MKESVRLGLGDPCILSGDTTVQELPIGYPNEPGILRGIAQRCLRALGNLKKKGVQGIESAIEKGKRVLRSVKEHHLFVKGKEEKEKILTRLIEETEDLMEEATRVVESIKESAAGVKQRAAEKLTTMKEVATQLIPQIIQWMKTGVVAKGKILHAGLTQARAIIRNKAGKKVEFGLKYLISRIGGGYLFGSLLLSCPDETKMPLQSLAGYRKIFGEKATPELIVYDRGGYAKGTIKKLGKEGVEKIGIQPKGKGEWLVSGEDRERVKSEGGKDGREHWDVENRKIWIQQAQGAQLGGASGVRAGVYSVVELEQVYERFGKFQEDKESSIGVERKKNGSGMIAEEGWGENRNSEMKK